ncbi:MAG TPA: hypothetical protein VGH87_24150 [Polyangiaceae bacterium]|jgi:hypothetical protein
MTRWISPDFIEIKMDAEIGSYQQDDDPIRGDDLEIEEEERD